MNIKSIKEHIEKKNYKILNGCKILIVDDNFVNRIVLKDILNMYGVEVIEAEDGLDALKKLSKDIDLIIMDCQMPKMDGYETTMKIREMDGFKDLPILALTASTKEFGGERALQVGMNGFLQKPINSDELIHTILKFLTKY
ncbi:response regulator [Deferribacter autotrophicus]|nr:response regulator [Deferribacter autotrophicus]